MKIIHSMHKDRGFSLIEVLVAVVILSVGLLALASLQLSLIRSSSGTKAQSIAMALAKEKLEQLASYKAMGGAASACVSPTAGGTNTCYRAITSEAIAAVDVDPVTTGTQSEVGGVSYSRGTTVTRYVFDKGALSAPKYFSVSNTALDSTIKALSGHSYLPGKEFKRIVVTVQWADSSGITQQVIVEDAISGIEPSDTVALSKNEGSGDPRKAVAIIVNPASVAGVIPIAVGNGSDTAATNPRPVLLSGSGKKLVETRYDVYTYAALSGTTAQAQSRVETSTIGCACTTGGGTQSTFRPTFWNGFRYVAPDTASGVPVSAPTSNVDQSTLCTSCCRDHQDPGSVTGEKFDPRRSAHNHYLSTNLSTPVVMTSAGSNYDEACRLIRVDGIFRVATETYIDYFGLLATAGLNQPTATTTVAGAVPGTAATTSYQTYVLNYLQARYIDSPESEYNTPLNPATVTGASDLDNPATAGIASASWPQFLHARGLIFDYVTDDVKTLITNAKNPANCPGTDALPADTADELQACVFKLLPFTSINLTELASWVSTNETKVEVTDGNFKSTIDVELPVKGEAVLKNDASAGDEADAQARIQRSSAGVAPTSQVFPDTELPAVNTISNVLTDANNQHFLVGTVVSTPSDELFYVVLTGSDMLSGVAYGVGNAPQVGFSLSNSACNGDANTGSDSTVSSDVNNILGDDLGSAPDEFYCVPDAGYALGGSVNVDVSNYNRILAADVTVANSCRSSGNTTGMSYSKDFDVSGASLIAYTTPGVDANSDGDYDDVGDTVPVTTSTSLGSGTVFNVDQPSTKIQGGEYTQFTINPLTDGQRIEIAFAAFSTSDANRYRCPSNWSTFINNDGTWKNLTNPEKQANCSAGNGNSSNNVPLWSSTYAACPTGFAPFQ